MVPSDSDVRTRCNHCALETMKGGANALGKRGSKDGRKGIVCEALYLCDICM